MCVVMHRWLKLLALHELSSHHPKYGDLLISAIVLAHPFHHILINREVFKHGTKVYCISDLFPKTEPNTR